MKSKAKQTSVLCQQNNKINWKRNKNYGNQNLQQGNHKLDRKINCKEK